MELPTKSIAVCGIVGMGPSVAKALVPAAMSTFGVVTKGVGTMHTAGGIAAILQYISTRGLVTGSLPAAVISLLYYNKDALLKRAKL